jgi:hypothetical protein
MRKIKQLISKISNWSNYNPPGPMTSKGWRLFEQEFKEVAPIRYWFKHNFKRAVIYPIKWKYNTVTDWIRYRTTHRYHVVNTGLPPSYYEVESRMLHVNFTLLKDFVEIEQARQRYLWSYERKDTPTWCEKHMPFYRLVYPFRRPDLGIKHFEWAATLDDPSLPPYERADKQAQDAREILALYKWWVDIRPTRREKEYKEYSDQGLGVLGSLDDDFDHNAEDYKAFREAMDENANMEDMWNTEDEDMLVRLIKIRRGLWA